MPADLLHNLSAEKEVWRCVGSGEHPICAGWRPQRRLEAVRSVDMSASNARAQFAASYFRRGFGIRRRLRLKNSAESISTHVSVCQIQHRSALLLVKAVSFAECSHPPMHRYDIGELFDHGIGAINIVIDDQERAARDVDQSF